MINLRWGVEPRMPTAPPTEASVGRIAPFLGAGLDEYETSAHFKASGIRTAIA
jgi:hypothetical protein